MLGWLLGSDSSSSSSSNSSGSTYEVFRANQRADGKTDNYFGNSGDKSHGHAVVKENGEVVYLRDTDGNITINKK